MVEYDLTKDDTIKENILQKKSIREGATVLLYVTSPFGVSGTMTAVTSDALSDTLLCIGIATSFAAVPIFSLKFFI